MNLSRRVRARLYAALGRIESPGLYAEAQAIATRLQASPIPEHFVELLECAARSDVVLRAENEKLKKAVADMRGMIDEDGRPYGEDVRALVDEWIESQGEGTRTHRPAMLLITSMHRQEATLEAIATELKNRGYKTPRGNTDWHPTQVQRIVNRLMGNRPASRRGRPRKNSGRDAL